MPSNWEIKSWLPCKHHVFLSHSREDHDRLVRPVFAELERRGLSPWIDYHHYPAGRDAVQSLREELLRSRHIAYFLHPARRFCHACGWINVERTLAELIQRQLTLPQAEIAHVRATPVARAAGPPGFSAVSVAGVDRQGAVSRRPGECPPTASSWNDDHVAQAPA